VDGVYRVATTATEAPRDQGIVGEVIAQFADRFAFFRELVQNAIDAGSPQVEVHLEHDAEAQVVRAGVRDTGEGMTREIVEEQLLVLFRSTKEQDDTKIGKFGIGFASVLAPAPNVVVVTTARDGRRLVLHLQRDLSYELFDGGPATRTGTTVELEIPWSEPFDDFVGASESALARWCRHAAVPIRLVAAAAGGGAIVRDVRIDRPMVLDAALVQVRGTSADGLTTAVVGFSAEAVPYAGFFDHGLTLYEESSPILGRLAFKVQDARLAHTLSRDNVRRDAAYERALEFARGLADRALPAEASRAVQAAAASGDRTAYVALCTAIQAAGVALSRGAWWFPLIEPAPGGDRVVNGDELPGELLGATRRSAITARLAAAGVVVLDLGAQGEVGAAIRRQRGEPLVDVHERFTLVTPVAPTDADRALLWLLEKLIAAAHRRPAGLALATFEGALAGQLAITGDRGDAAVDAGDGDDGGEAGAPWLIERRRAGRKPFGRLSRAPIQLDAEHALVAAARARAATDPVSAASLLARALLLRAGELDIERSERLLLATLAALGVDA
jgi:hypothetical protein